MTFVWIESSDPRYPEWLAMRQRILRDPIGVVFSEEDRRAEEEQLHLLAIVEDEMVGGLIVQYPDPNPKIWKVRQVAVLEHLQGQGLGRALMEKVIEEANAAGVEQLMLHSREGVVEFYERLGFRVVGEPFEEVGIPHRKMIFDPASA